MTVTIFDFVLITVLSEGERCDSGRYNDDDDDEDDKGIHAYYGMIILIIASGN